MNWFTTKKSSSFNWLWLTDDNSFQLAMHKSFERKILIFKHSTRCSISSMALYRIEDNVKQKIAACYLLDLLKYRSISNKIEEELGVKHESPQILVIENGVCTYHSSHNDISWDRIPI